MQIPEGKLVSLDDLGITTREENPLEALAVMRAKSVELEKATGKVHPVFSAGEIVTVKGGRFRVSRIRKNRLILKPVRY